MEIISWILFILLIAGVLTLGALLLRGYLEKDTSAELLKGRLFNPRPPQKRLDVVDQITIDGRRRLVLIRRDNVEHLIMTGGPVDVVIETNIAKNSNQVRVEPAKAPATSRAALKSIDDSSPSNAERSPDKTPEN